jgi:hypothetical protein
LRAWRRTRDEPSITLRISIARQMLRDSDIDDTRQVSNIEEERLAVRAQSQMK